MTPRRIDTLSDLSKLALLSLPALPLLDPPLRAIVNGLDRGLGVRRLTGVLFFVGGLGAAAAAGGEGAATSLASSL